MKTIDKAKDWLKVVKMHFNNENMHDDVSYTSFLLSLLPIPGFKECNQVIDRISVNTALRLRFDEIWTGIKNTNQEVSKIDDEIKRLQEIGGTVNFNNNLKEQVQQLVQEIIEDISSGDNSEWIMDTDNWSYQEVLNSIVDVDIAEIKANNNSVNVVKNTKIKAKRTHLKAHDKSENFVDKTLFSGSKGSVGMEGISTQGDITVEGSGIGFGVGSSITFKGNSDLITGNCSFCNERIELDKSLLGAKTQIECPKCGTMLKL